MTKQDMQTALLAAYLKRDSAQTQLDEATKEISAYRNMLAGVQVSEASKPKEVEPAS